MSQFDVVCSHSWQAYLWHLGQEAEEELKQGVHDITKNGLCGSKVPS